MFSLRLALGRRRIHAAPARGFVTIHPDHTVRRLPRKGRPFIHIHLRGRS